MKIVHPSVEEVEVLVEDMTDTAPGVSCRRVQDQAAFSPDRCVSWSGILVHIVHMESWS